MHGVQPLPASAIGLFACARVRARVLWICRGARMYLLLAWRKQGSQERVHARTHNLHRIVNYVITMCWVLWDGVPCSEQKLRNFAPTT